jgi:ATP-binding cassette subfamily B protein
MGRSSPSALLVPDPATPAALAAVPIGAMRSPAAGQSVQPCVLSAAAAARHCGIELDPAEFRDPTGMPTPSSAALAAWLRSAGLWVSVARLGWRQLLRLGDAGAVVLLLADGDAATLAGVDHQRNLVFLRDERASVGQAAMAVDELQLERRWTGEALLVRARRGLAEGQQRLDLRWVARLVLGEKRLIRDVGLGSLSLSLLTVFPPLVVMSVVDKVLTHGSYSTLTLLAVALTITTIGEVLLGHARRSIVLVVGMRLDARLSLEVFGRLLRLPLDYFERHPAGETMHKIAEVHRIREFLTGKLLTLFLDTMTLAVLLPLLFWLDASLAVMVLGCAIFILLVIAAFLRPLRHRFSLVVATETAKAAALGETVFGVRTVKSLALEPQRNALWDARVADAAKRRLDFGRLANWPQALVTPAERMMSIGVVLVGADLALADHSAYAVGGLFAFMMLSARVAQPLVGLARLIEDYESVGAAIGELGSVLNRPPEADPAAGGLRPCLAGAITFDDVSFTYDGAGSPALANVSFSVPAGTMLGVVGRSGSGKSTLTRLLQGINRDYSGLLKIDGNDVRAIELRHLRRSLGVVLQENFLFRGSIRDNIIAGRPGFVLADAVRAARLAGAEEFIERLPHGYDTLIEEGSPNLSGGQRQRLAIARALIHDPRILILDEATSALDPESEALLSANLLRIASGRTMVIVSHRLSSLTWCDQILVLDGGRVAAIGPHPALVERCTAYRQLWVQQSRPIDRSGHHAVVAAAPSGQR